MKILIFEDNLIWSVRLKKSIQSLGHEPIVLSKIPENIPEAKIAILNLSMDSLLLRSLIPKLKEQSIYLVAHAGHKEKEKLEFGKEIGCDQIVSNGTLTYKIEKILNQICNI